ncbi:GAP family protein [Nocardia camponoti]|uniref:Membrane protein n=1 Tax=Nocardia camponoti TaxID=1616106 RepID=A0A917VB89_9NOCA|nr:GAP family protein [Nocardia camponoti]GGK58220.1 membrane protein [Nocardia camponoti]
MGTVIGDLLPLGIGVAISPIPIIAAILMVLSSNARSAAKGFAGGWVAGIVVITLIFIWMSTILGTSTAKEPSTAASWCKIILGLALVVLAVQQWWSRADDAEPEWMATIDKLTTGRAAAIGFLLSGINPKNLLLCVTAGIVIGSGGVSAGGDFVALIIFTLIASCTVLGVVIGYLVAAEKLEPTLHSLRDWLQVNNHLVMAIVLAVMGALVFGRGIGGL